MKMQSTSTIVYYFDENGTQLGRWMENYLEFFVSTLHKVGKIIKRARNMPRKIAKNKQHADKVLGDQEKSSIFMLTWIDNYNHWIGGVDSCDYIIAHYKPNLRCRRTQITMFLQIMSITHSNSCITCKSCAEIKPMPHKSLRQR